MKRSRNRTQEWKPERARVLRKNATPEEVLLWTRLRKDQLGVRFRRSHLLYGYIVDFYCPSGKLVVEVDGLAHQEPEHAQEDAQKDQVLEMHDIKVVRITNKLVNMDLEAAVGIIQQALEAGRTLGEDEVETTLGKA